MSKRRTIASAMTLTILMTCSSVWAVLGGSSGTLEVDHQPLSGQTRTIPGPDFSVHELTTPDLVVREYISGQGKVFGVSWTGRRSPDLPVLFGSYFEQYEAASAERNARRSPLRGVTQVETSDLVVETGGPMGAIWGRAYLPNFLPPGVTKEAIQ